MDLTAKNKETIDQMNYEQLLANWRFSKVGDPWFQGETGEYWANRMKELRERDPEGSIRASKNVGWNNG